jgi:hypothetical protein
VAALAAVLTALAAPAQGVTPAADASRTVSFGHAAVVVQVMPTGTVCYRVTEHSGTARSCRSRIGAGEIGFAVSPRGIGGVAGDEVHAVIVKLTRRGTVWATVREGAFYADVPLAYRVRAVVKVLRDGSRKAFPVTPPS